MSEILNNSRLNDVVSQIFFNTLLKIKRFFLKKSSSIGKEKKFSLSEHPIKGIDEDIFGVSDNIVNKINYIINDKTFTNLTIAITGQWGSGKSSAMNLIRNDLKKVKKNIVINFEPLLEGKLEIADIMLLFYLKLYKDVISNKKSKKKKMGEFLTKSIESILILAECKLSENINKLLNHWKKLSPKDFSEQTAEFNNLLFKDDYRLFILIDEIDRLPANYILNFLLFCRILESFDRMTCVVGIDYEQTIHKLIKENAFNGIHDSDTGDQYIRAKNYLDKLFQITVPVHHDKYQKYKFVRDWLTAIDSDNCLTDIINSNNYEKKEELEKIIDYLDTPRQIKKWLISLKVNVALIKDSKNYQLDFMAFLAATIKHPILIEYTQRVFFKIYLNI